jgi:hypothetical protein
MNFEPRDEHRWLARLAGAWTFEGEAAAGPGEPAACFTGRERVHMLGEAWAVCEMSDGDDPGTPPRSMMTLGFDPARERFVGSFVTGPLGHLWIYDGALDAARRTLTLDTMGPGADGAGLVPYRDVIEIAGDDARTLRSEMRGSDGGWRDVMTCRYRRVG